MSGVESLNLRKLGGRLGRNNMMLVVILVITSLVVTGFAWAHKRVNIIADGNTYNVTTFRSNPKDVLAQAAVYLGPKDEFRISTTNLIDGTSIEVYRAVPVTVIFQDKTEVITTGKPTVGELAESLGFSKETARTSPGEETRVAAGMNVRIVALTSKMISQAMPVAPPVVRQPDPTMEKGVEEVVQEGTEGVKQAAVKLFLEDGQQVKTEIVSENVVVAPTPTIIKVGTRDTVETSRGALRFRETHWMEATAYTPTDGSPHGITASGIPARYGIVAVDPGVIPLGTRLFIPGYGFALAADTGGAICGERIDLCFESHREAYSFGRRMIKVYVID